MGPSHKPEFTPNPPRLGLLKSLALNKSPLGDLGVVLKKRLLRQPYC